MAKLLGIDELESSDGSGTGLIALDKGGAVFNVKHTDFGAVGDGVTDDTAAIQAAVTAAAAAGVPLHLGEGTIRLIHSSTIDLTGIPELLGSATLDCSGSTATTKFRVQGSKTALATELALSAGTNTITISSGSVERGDVVILTSDEEWPGVPGLTGTYGYYKGSRHTVQSVSGSTVTLFPYIPFDYLGAYAWRVDEARIKIGSEITFLGNPGEAESGLRLEYADAEIAAHFRGFGVYACAFACSRGSFTGTVRDVHFTGTGTSYGVAVGDLSEVRIFADIEAGRHAVQGGGGALFNLDESGGSSAAAAYPASYSVPGGIYKTSSLSEEAAIDAHGSMWSVAIGPCEVYGGITVGAANTKLSGTKVYFKDNDGIRIRDDNRSTSWGHLEVNGVELISMGATGQGADADGVMMGSVARLARLTIRGLTIRGVFDTGRPLNITGQITDLDIEGLTIRRTGGSSSSVISAYSSPRLRGLDVSGDTIIVTALASDLELELENSKFRSGLTYGFYGAVSGSFVWARVLLNGVNSRLNPSSGIRVGKSVRVNGRNLISGDNGTNSGASSSDRSGLTVLTCERLDLSGCDFSSSANQVTGFHHTVFDGGDPTATTVLLSGIDLRGNTSTTQAVIGGTVLRRLGVLGTISSAPIADVIESADGDLFQIDASGALVAFP